MIGPRIFVDLDGVLVDFISAALRCHDALDALETWTPGEWSVPRILGISKSEFWRVIDAKGHEFWADLAPYPWKQQLVDLVASFDPSWTVATAPSLNPACPHGKITWMQTHLDEANGRPFTRFMIGPDKHVLAGPGSILIDDSDKKIDAFAQSGGIGILFPQPWNSLHDIRDAMAHVTSRLTEAVDAIRRNAE